MEITIRGETKEIAALVLAVQGRQTLEFTGRDLAQEIHQQWDCLLDQIEPTRPSQ